MDVRVGERVKVVNCVMRGRSFGEQAESAHTNGATPDTNTVRLSEDVEVKVTQTTSSQVVRAFSNYYQERRVLLLPLRVTYSGINIGLRQRAKARLPTRLGGWRRESRLRFEHSFVKLKQFSADPEARSDHGLLSHLCELGPAAEDQ